MNKKNKLVVKENFDEDDLSDDVDDEVFVRDGKKNSVKMEKHKGDEQPLMPVRRKTRQRQNTSAPEVCNRQPCNIYNCLLPVYFGIAAIISIAFLMLLYIFLVDRLPLLVNKLGWWSADIIRENNTLAPCSNFKLNRIWSQKFPKLYSDSQIKLIDIDKDGINDIVIGTATEKEDALNSRRICNYEFLRRNRPCLGGVIAINGKTGSIIWQLWLTRMVLAVHCDFEITSDEVSDCVVTGKGGLLLAVSGIDGSVIWQLESVSESELYNVLITHDVNQDGFLDIIASHYMQNKKLEVQSCILVISGKGGEKLHQLPVPSYEPILHSPQIVTDLDGGENIIFVTGDLTHSGGLYIISMRDLLSDDNKIQKLYHLSTGILAAPLMIDVNLDAVHDIVFSASNTVYAIDGTTFTTIWNTSLHDFVPNTYQITVTSSVTPAYFNDDRIPDLLVTFSVGATYPEYYYSVILVLNGRTGRSLLNEPVIRSSVPDTEGGISLSFTGLGNDAFIYWTASCKNYVDAKTSFSFSTSGRQLYADLCDLRFNSTTQLQVYALNQHVQPPGVLLRSENSYENWDFDIRENADVGNEPAKLYYKISTRDKNFRRPPVLPSDLENTDDKPYSNGENDYGNTWKSHDASYPNNGGPVAGLGFNDNPQDQIQIGDYGTDNDISMNGRNEKQYDVPLSGGGGVRFIRNIPNPPVSSGRRKMVPKVSASGVITKSLQSNNLGEDLILMHYEIKSDPDVCIIINKEKRCSSRGEFLNPKINKHYDLSAADKIQGNMIANSLFFNDGQKYDKNSLETSDSPVSNLYIFRYSLTCDCVYLQPENEVTCSTMLPYENQSYPAYLGRFGNSAFVHRDTFS